MNMRGDNAVKRRGKSKLKTNRGPPITPYSETNGVYFKDFLINKHTTRDIIFPYERKGGWTYPKPGFIQWKNGLQPPVENITLALAGILFGLIFSATSVIQIEIKKLQDIKSKV